MFVGFWKNQFHTEVIEAVRLVFALSVSGAILLGRMFWSAVLRHTNTPPCSLGGAKDPEHPVQRNNIRWKMLTAIENLLRRIF